jgi:hypothetical protein
LDALAHGSLGQANGLSDSRVGPPSVLLQLLDDRLGEFIELEAAPGREWLIRNDTAWMPGVASGLTMPTIVHGIRRIKQLSR